MQKISGLVLALSLASGAAQAHIDKINKVESHSRHEVCAGFLPPNDMKIPVGSKMAKGIARAEYDRVLDKIYALYVNEVAEHGARLKINRLWKSPDVNAAAFQENGVWELDMYGGMARHKAITSDAFALVACHEMGHHLGGAPKYANEDGTYEWATNEGGSDYYAALKCMRRFFERDDNEKILAGRQLDPIAVRYCESRHINRRDELICIRTTMAGLATADLFASMGKKRAALATPDQRQVSKTDDRHPEPQCRLDTYFRSSLCTVPVSQDLDDRDYRPGSCYDARVTPMGLRPRCWFKPE